VDDLLRYWPVLLALIGFASMWGDTRRQHKSHREITQQGFSGVNGRLDKVNGRIDRAEDRLQEHGERIAKLEP
jgi:hypothetical protein